MANTMANTVVGLLRTLDIKSRYAACTCADNCRRQAGIMLDHTEECASIISTEEEELIILTEQFANVLADSLEQCRGTGGGQ